MISVVILGMRRVRHKVFIGVMRKAQGHLSMKIWGGGEYFLRRLEVDGDKETECWVRSGLNLPITGTSTYFL
jgi:hypothetical protein